SARHPDLLSFPTRRSSDLREAVEDRPHRHRDLIELLPVLLRGPRPRRGDDQGALVHLPEAGAPERAAERAGRGEAEGGGGVGRRSEEHTSELQSLAYLVCR